MAYVSRLNRFNRSKHEKMILDLITDHKTGKLSSSKVWLNIGCAALTFCLIRQAAITYDIILAYGGIVVGNNVAVLWIKGKINADTGVTK